MSTSKSLQTPSVVQVIGSTIRISHPSIQGNTTTYLRSPIAVGGTAMSVGDNTNINDADNLVIGNPQDPLTEAVLVNGAVTLGSAVIVANTLKFAHDLDAPVTKVWERTVVIYGSAISGGSLSVAIATINIQWGKDYTEYTLLTVDTAYAYYVAKYGDGTIVGTASAYVPATGLTYLTVENFIQQALDITNSQLDGNLLNRDMFVRWMEDAQLFITQFTYQDPVNGKFIQKDWGFEVIEDKSSISLTVNENEYALSLLASASKYPNSQKSIIDMRIGSQIILKPRSIDEYDNYMAYRPRTTVATTPSVGQTTLVLADASELAAGGGNVIVGSDTLTYTAISTNTLTGIPTSGAGSITSTYSVGSAVWQNITAKLPSSYTIFNGTIKLDAPIPTTYVGQKLKIRYFYTIPRITSVSDTTVIPFTNVFQWYLSANIEKRKGNDDKHASYMDMFNKKVLANALSDMVPVNDEFKYYNYYDDFQYDGLNLGTPTTRW